LLGPQTEAGQSALPTDADTAETGRSADRNFSSNVSDVISCMPYFVIPWLAIDLVD